MSACAVRCALGGWAGGGGGGGGRRRRRSPVVCLLPPRELLLPATADTISYPAHTSPSSVPARARLLRRWCWRRCWASCSWHVIQGSQDSIFLPLADCAMTLGAWRAQGPSCASCAKQRTLRAVMEAASLCSTSKAPPHEQLRLRSRSKQR